MNLPEPTAIWHLPGHEVHVFDALESTNSHALAMADDPRRDGLAILARSQSAGRGQYGRNWSAPVGSSVLLSVLRFPPLSLRRPVVLTAWATVAVCETILELTGLDATIKWPNDVLIRGKKVSGILIEQRTTGDPNHPLSAVVGIGLNVRQNAVDFAALPAATSLAIETGQSLETDAVSQALLSRLDGSDLATLESRWRRRLGLAGQRVRAECVAGVFKGRLVDIAFAGLVLQGEDSLEHLPPESIRHLHRE